MLAAEFRGSAEASPYPLRGFENSSSVVAFQETSRQRRHLVGPHQRKIRAVGARSGDTIQWIWIGTHNEFNNLFS
jgi:hypothetical protein